MKLTSLIFPFALVILLSNFAFAQNSSTGPFSYKTDIRLLHFGSDTHSLGMKGPNSFRVRFETTFSINESNRLHARLAGSLSENGEPVRFTILNDGKRLGFGSVSFDTFNYHYQNADTEIKIGRFQHNMVIQSVSKRSHFRFQSPINHIQWTDGLYLKQQLQQGWFTEVVAEYQHRDHLSYSYHGGLDFGNNTHNVAGFLNLETLERDRFNFIQKGFGLFYAPAANNLNGVYRDYIAVMSRIAYDLPRPGLLQGGSFRVSAEAGQSLNNPLSDGTNITFSMGVKNFSGRHSFLTELARTDTQWLTASVFAPSSDEIEFRYILDVNTHLRLSMRYRIRDFRTTGVPNAYSTFFRATIKF